MKTDLWFTPQKKINFRQITDLEMNGINTKASQKHNKKEYVHDYGIGKDIINRTQKHYP